MMVWSMHDCEQRSVGIHTHTRVGRQSLSLDGGDSFLSFFFTFQRLFFRILNLTIGWVAAFRRRMRCGVKNLNFVWRGKPGRYENILFIQHIRKMFFKNFFRRRFFDHDYEMDVFWVDCIFW